MRYHYHLASSLRLKLFLLISSIHIWIMAFVHNRFQTLTHQVTWCYWFIVSVIFIYYSHRILLPAFHFNFHRKNYLSHHSSGLSTLGVYCLTQEWIVLKFPNLYKSSLNFKKYFEGSVRERFVPNSFLQKTWSSSASCDLQYTCSVYPNSSHALFSKTKHINSLIFNWFLRCSLLNAIMVQM